MSYGLGFYGYFLLAEDIGAIINQVAGNSLADKNILDTEENCTLQEFTLDGFENSFNYTVPAYSVTATRLKTKYILSKTESGIVKADYFRESLYVTAKPVTKWWQGSFL